MKRFFTLSLFLLLFGHLFSQIYVSNNSYVFNKGSLIYSKGSLELNGINSNFFLRNEGQLLQGSLSYSTNKGIGKLSVFQEGTVNNYAYNYWCSPVGNASTTAGNEDFGITMLNVPTTKTTSVPASMISPSWDGNSGSGSLGIATQWIYRFLSSLTYSQWFYTGSATTISAGQGFTMKGTSGSDPTNPSESVANNPGSKQRYDFRGKPNDGDITINVANGMFTLTGNPYPSAIDLSAFLTNATNSTGVAYFWEQDKTVNSHLIANYKGGYGTFSPVSRGGTGIYVPAQFYAFDGSGNQLGLTSTPNNSYARYFSPIGQGFMIQGNGLGSTVTMKNAYRVFQKENITTSVFEKNTTPNNSTNAGYLPEIPSVSGFDYKTVSTLEVPQIRFNTMLNNEAINQIVLAFDNDATDFVDHAKDAKSPNANSPMNMYFVLDNSEYVISVIQFDDSKRLPVGFRTNVDANIKIKVADIINFDQANSIFLYDKITGIYHDIKNLIYEFEVPAGITNDRYEITFRNDALSLTTPTKDNLVILQDNSKQLLSILNPNLMDIKSINLYDISGKSVFKKIDLGMKSSFEIPTSSLSEGVYLLELEPVEEPIITQKIIVKSQN